jgi:hypothetical protein
MNVSMENVISRAHRTLGVRLMPDDHDSGRCFLGDGRPGEVRVNLDGVWMVLCVEHQTALIDALNHPLPPPERG